MDYNKIINLITENPDIAEFADYGNGTSDEWIQKAQLRLNVVFPPSYIWWLKNYGGGYIYGDEIFSVYELDFDSIVGGDIVYVNELNRKRGFSNHNELVIQENDQGETFYFDLLSPNSNGEYPVYNKIKNTKYADNFLEFLEKKIRE